MKLLFGNLRRSYRAEMMEKPIALSCENTHYTLSLRFRYVIAK
jgi:hypothetical protein